MLAALKALKAKEADEKKAQAKAKAKARTTAKAKAKTTSTKTTAKAKADSKKAFIPACIVNSDIPGHITRVLQEGAEVWNLGGYNLPGATGGSSSMRWMNMMRIETLTHSWLRLWSFSSIALCRCLSWSLR